jgi:hypothetical protein
VLEVAGQPIRLPIETVSSISFTGSTSAISSSAAVSTSKPVETALASLKSLKAATEIGMLRSQYSQKLVELLPQVSEFVSSKETTWVDARLAMLQAIEYYRMPLSTLE